MRASGRSGGRQHASGAELEAAGGHEFGCFVAFASAASNAVLTSVAGGCQNFKQVVTLVTFILVNRHCFLSNPLPGLFLYSLPCRLQPCIRACLPQKEPLPGRIAQNKRNTISAIR